MRDANLNLGHGDREKGKRHTPVHDGLACVTNRFEVAAGRPCDVAIDHAQRGQARRAATQAIEVTGRAGAFPGAALAFEELAQGAALE